jgi:hypothetical protein
MGTTVGSSLSARIIILLPNEEARGYSNTRSFNKNGQ